MFPSPCTHLPELFVKVSRVVRSQNNPGDVFGSHLHRQQSIARFTVTSESPFPRYQTQTSETKSGLFDIAVVRATSFIRCASLIFRLDRFREREETFPRARNERRSVFSVHDDDGRTVARSFMHFRSAGSYRPVRSSFKGNRNAETVSVV